MGKSKKRSEKRAERDARKPAGANQKAPKQRQSDRLAHRAPKPAKVRSRRQHDLDWSAPAPTHLIAKLDVPKTKSKYHTYFEFAANTEKKKKLEYQVTDDHRPPPGFEFVPFGDPTLTNACKELSRERGAMIFIVSSSKEVGSKVSEHVYRTGYHFRSIIVDEARAVVGETSRLTSGDGFVDPIPESQAEINAQADAAIRDLYPRVPNTDRQMIIEHAFQKGVKFQGEATVGLQPEIPLSRRVQLAVLAHIRHTHTRYDYLLRETSWLNARKVVEPVCLDVLLKWRGDEETGRDQMDEILREVVVITDSEAGDDDCESESSEEEGEIISPNLRDEVVRHSRDGPSRNHSRHLSSAQITQTALGINGDLAPSKIRRVEQLKQKKAQRGFKRYQAAWDQALSRRANASQVSSLVPLRHSTDNSVRPARARFTPPYRYNYTKEGPSAMHTTNIDHEALGSRSLSQVYPKPLEVSSPGMLIYRDRPPVRSQPSRLKVGHSVSQHLNLPSPAMTPGHFIDATASPRPRELRDMLVPSIEKTLCDPESLESSSKRVFNGYHDGFPAGTSGIPNHQPNYGRRVPSEQCIIVDDGKATKRRRLMSDHRDLRAEPVTPYSGSTPVIRREPQLLSLPAASLKDSVRRVSRESLLSPRDMSRGLNPHMSGRSPVMELPVYAVSETGELRRISDNVPKGQDLYSSAVHRGSGFPHPTQTQNHLEGPDFRPCESYSSVSGRSLRPLSSDFPASRSASRSYLTMGVPLRKVSSQLETPHPHLREHIGYGPLQTHGPSGYEYEPHINATQAATVNLPQHPTDFVSTTRYRQDSLQHPFRYERVERASGTGFQPQYVVQGRNSEMDMQSTHNTSQPGRLIVLD